MAIVRQIYSNPEAAAEACGQHILRLLQRRLTGSGGATLAVSGGSTPRIMFAWMARQPFDWRRIHLFWVDERSVPPTDAQSNYRLTDETFIGPARFPKENVHRIAGELEPAEAAAQYVAGLKQYFGTAPGEVPRFDVVHRGIGADAHTASLFPGEPLIADREHLAAAVHVEKLASWRVTLLPGVLLNARHTAMLVCGADKAPAVRNIFNEPYDPMRFPAQLTHRAGPGETWFLDEPAASRVVD